MSAPRVRLSRSATQAARSGHPWIFKEERQRFPSGTLVELADGKTDATVGWALADDGPIAFRVLGRHKVPVPQLLRERIAAANRLRMALMGPHTDGWRLVAGAGDGLDGLVVDRYAELAVLKVYAACWLPYLEHVVDAVAGLPWCRSVLRRYGVERVDGRDGAEILHGPAPADVIEIREHGMRLLVRPFVGQKTGTFLDQREHRGLVRRWSAGRQVANLFGYTGGFSVAAALGGAERVITVDLAPEAVADARDNFRRNDIDPDRHGFEVADAFSWRAKQPQDLLIIDPPSLARDRKSEDAARAAYRKLHRHHGAQVAHEGLLATSSCTARLDLGAWRQIVEEGLANDGPWSWHWISGEPPDHPVALRHPEGSYLKFALLRRRR
ncbi:MAG: class I SAM-dependent rRNA methyltransferase [Myxococcales bacterium]|nr:class I SAM-dependent rRNA methyltransferase [Myxococcales bacterium]